MIIAAAGLAIPAVFVFELDANHRSAVFPELSPELLADLAEQRGDLGKIRSIVAACRTFGQNPVGKADFARLRWYNPTL